MAETVREIKKTKILLLDHFDDKAQMLLKSVRQAGFSGPVVCMDDDGFLPQDVTGLFHWFLREGRYGVTEEKDGKKNKQKFRPRDGKARYFNQIELPDYWRIAGDNRHGEIWDVDEKRGEIIYANYDPHLTRIVKAVQWYDKKGVVRYTDYYDRFGQLYGRMTCDKAGKDFQMSWFDQNGQEVLTENRRTRDFILNRDGKVLLFKHKTDLTLYFLKEYEKLNQLLITDIWYNSLSHPFFVSMNRNVERQDGDILFWQEGPRNDVPGNMQMIFKGQTRTKKVLVQNKQSYENLLKAGASAEMTDALGFVYDYYERKADNRDALILTNSDQIEHLEDFAKRFPSMQFHVAAVTEMSKKLLDMGKFENITLYPSVTIKVVEELFKKCDYYLDINYGGEILDAVKTAFLFNQLILGHELTAHNRTYTAPQHIFVNYEELAGYLEKVLAGGNLANELNLQKVHAMDAKADDYRKLLR